MSRRLIQIAVAIAGLVPVGAGAAGVLLGAAMIPLTGSMPISADSHWRYLSGLLLGIGLAFWSLIPRIESQGRLFQTLTGIVVAGGLGRLWALMAVGIPDKAMMFGLTMELVVTPALAIWQYRLARGSKK